MFACLLPTLGDLEYSERADRLIQRALDGEAAAVEGVPFDKLRMQV